MTGMEFIPIIVLALIAVWIVRSTERKRAYEERLRQAYKFDVPPIHGTRKFASDKELKKAGLI